jgi:XTP/dITP diphosphohydrolase
MKGFFMEKLLIASENRGKLLEIHALLQDMPFDLVYPSLMGIHINVAEDGDTYAENAARKALAYTQASGLMTLADDSGLEVKALGGLPGLHSARFALHPGATDADRRALLLSKLADHPRPWEAVFHCTVAIASPDGKVRYTQGECQGEIIPIERGLGGFGYDPLFLIPELGLTMAELSMDQKNELSHRARAVISARPILKVLFEKIKEN